MPSFWFVTPHMALNQSVNGFLVSWKIVRRLQRPETGNWHKGTSASIYAMLRDDHTAGKKTRMATAGQTGIDGMLRLTKNVAQAP